jgi:hypothetical protein
MGPKERDDPGQSRQPVALARPRLVVHAASFVSRRELVSASAQRS